MVQHVYERVARARRVEAVYVATDDQRISSAVEAFGGRAILTSPHHASGTDRLAEAVIGLPEANVIVNVQGDEPLIDPAHVDAAIAPLMEDASLPAATIAVRLSDPDEALSPDVVKVVCDDRDRALYFSRSLIPHVRLTAAATARDRAAAAIERGLAWRHVGLYVYRRETLLAFSKLPPAPLESAEALEQLRLLHHGLRLHVVHLNGPVAPAVDSPDDLERVRALMEASSRASSKGERCTPSTSS
jgi:3-deoxy-manno-octulosonate cytidylyltransferase (CMP-KDO synthetase)